MEENLYFANDSDIGSEQMSWRCPLAKVVGPVVLENYVLQFRAGSAMIAPREGSQVHGVLWKLTEPCKKALSYYKGYPRYHDRRPVTVRTSDGKEIEVMTYVMTDEKSLMPSMPTGGYYRSIQKGYQKYGLPEQALEETLERTQQEIRQWWEKRRNDYER